MSRYDADDTYYYPDTDVLRNKAEITIAQDLDTYEGELSTLRSIEILENPIAGQFDLAHLQHIHSALFQDWAGEIRAVDISRSNSRFANVDFRLTGGIFPYRFFIQSCYNAIMQHEYRRMPWAQS